MRVLHAVTLHTPTGAFGGPVRVALNLAKGLAARGHRPRLVALADGFPRPLPADVEGVPARLFAARRVLPLGFSGLTSPALLAGAGRLVRAADVVHVHLARDLVTLPVALAALRARRPLVLQTHGMVDPSGRSLARVLDTLAVRRVLRSADRLLYLTDHERDDLERVAGPCPPGRAVRLVNGVPAQEAGAAPAGPPRVLYAARLHERKRPRDFVAAAPAILRRYPDAEFVVAGPDEGELPAVRALVAGSGLAHKVHLPGPLSGAQMLTELRRAHVYVLPSVAEPFPMSVLEAMSVGTPVVVTRSNGLARDVEKAGAGRVVTAADGIADAVLDLLAPDTRRAAASAGRALTAEAFSMDTVLDTLVGEYERVRADTGR
ncbi:glycosyltransferase [Streptomyces sp. TS71-3]|uniref:glycosyltransferase n=1 Tax=Streptomyces sp. TS71-3 TaxID=2733862 RepID=UPI001B19125B|nr:glycosyltransferase [Streptomyces sp. TS71-3]GHJ42035.1 glycosyl transferase family 1 [Streptomyces sp. TS71-3]